MQTLFVGIVLATSDGEMVGVDVDVVVVSKRE
jgi:hypothetical protein